ncbi:MAG TPA: bifunctional diaminohydroxyphosphoribosylaminopyrimidine deaminase/5-amino-6-(5-phosphoribosylamino)uracil reductase RibD [Burkholderiaceae bacterium]|nr:bifunctional diaminohydroxyphosphoribosylaminopyrimidine deaminase/5-amino-6-(5-phosphoribosylamino)uracil reductase RibD [Burkholderiaceae bacterium]
MSRHDEHWMRRAIDLARQVMYLTAPNPRVGCVIVRDGQVLGEGATQEAGGPHAEVMALRDLHRHHLSAEGATVYVTLEPCSHHGRTPPCVEALIAERPARMVVAMLDPNPLVGGRGLGRLRDVGIAVTTSICTEEALELNPGFVARMTRRTPWVWLKLAASLDGRSALNNGVSQWITGPTARADGHHWRARSSVVLTGLGTILADDPRLDVRLVETPRQPIRAVVDPRFEIPEDARLFGGGPVWVFTARNDPEKAARLAAMGARAIFLPMVDDGAPSIVDDVTWSKVDDVALSKADNSALRTADDGAGSRPRVDLNAMLRWMAEQEVNEVHVEAGPGLCGALLGAGCVDELLVYLAPMLLGDAQPMARLPALASLDQARRFQFLDSVFLAPDMRLRARCADRWQALLEAVQAPSA